VTVTRVRVPDVCVCMGAEPEGHVFRMPPFLLIEILSQDDRATDLLERLDDYREFHVPFVWVVDPRTKRGYTFIRESGFDVVESDLRTLAPNIELPIERLFE
jgi:Uncharacterized protein conserved in cyanobacteria